jgi:hypothetical protein
MLFGLVDGGQKLVRLTFITQERDGFPCVGQDHFLEFDLELVEIPLALLAEPIDREPQQTHLLKSFRVWTYEVFDSPVT